MARRRGADRKGKIPARAAASAPVLKADRCLFTDEFAEVNVSSLNRFEDGAMVDPVALIEIGILKNVRDGVRILGNGELTKKLTVKANGFTKTAAEKITAAGGKVEVI